jgi:steroid delta-isomerase-like uncharacterized protein
LALFTNQRKEIIMATVLKPAVSEAESGHIANVHESLVRDWFAAWNSHDAVAIASLYTPDGTFETVPTGKISRGTNELADTFREIFSDYPDLRCEPQFMFHAADAAFGEFIMSGTRAGTGSESPPAGKHISVRVGYIIELESGKIKRHIDYFDGATLAHQLGML